MCVSVCVCVCVYVCDQGVVALLCSQNTEDARRNANAEKPPKYFANNLEAPPGEINALHLRDCGGPPDLCG